MTRSIIFALSILLLPSVLAAAPPSDASPAVPAGASAAPELCASSVQAKILTTPEFGAFSGCTADCWDGTTVTCSGSECEAQDATCDPFQRGRCSSDAEGEKLCPDHSAACACPTPSCYEVAGSSCKSGSVTCYLQSQNCQPLTCDCFGGTYHC